MQMHTRKVRTAALVAASVAVGVALAPAGAYAAQLTQVFVTNDSAHAVPVQGTVNVGSVTSPVVTADPHTWAFGFLAAASGEAAVDSVSSIAAVTTDTISVDLIVTTGVGTKVSFGCRQLDSAQSLSIEVPLSFAYTEGSLDHYQAVVTDVAAPCGDGTIVLRADMANPSVTDEVSFNATVIAHARN
jgi:hypothetical protein